MVSETGCEGVRKVPVEGRVLAQGNKILEAGCSVLMGVERPWGCGGHVCVQVCHVWVRNGWLLLLLLDVLLMPCCAVLSA